MSVPRPAMLVAMVTAPLRPGLRDDRGLALVVLGVEDHVRDARFLEARRERLARLDRHRADQHRLPALVAVADLLDDRAPLLLGGAVDHVLVVLADHRLVGGDHHHVELVDLVELGGLGVGRAGHAGELLVHAEVVLEGDGGERLVLALDLDAFLGLDRLVQAVGPAPAGHHAAGELVDDDDLAVLDQVVDVALEQVCARRPWLTPWRISMFSGS